MPFIHTDLVKLLNGPGASWPLDVIATQAGISEKAVKAFLRDGVLMEKDDYERLSNWAERHAAITAIGVPAFRQYMPSQTMGLCLAVSANDLPKGKTFEPGETCEPLKVVDELKTLAAVNAVLDRDGGSMTGAGERVKIKQLAKSA
jgi:hypothetical protein